MCTGRAFSLVGHHALNETDSFFTTGLALLHESPLRAVPALSSLDRELNRRAGLGILSPPLAIDGFVRVFIPYLVQAIQLDDVLRAQRLASRKNNLVSACTPLDRILLVGTQSALVISSPSPGEKERKNQSSSAHPIVPNLNSS